MECLIKPVHQARKYLGNGLAVIDFGRRVGNVQLSYKEGGDWERELFRESLSFAGSAGLGMLAVNAGLRLLIFATPYGWAWLMAGGVATAAVSAGSTILFDNLAKQRSDDWYNALLKALE